MGTSNINDIKNDVKAKEIIPKKIKHLDHLQVVFFLLYLSVSTAILSSTSWEVVTLQHFSNLTTGYWNIRLFLEENTKINLPALTRFKRRVYKSSPWSKKALETEFSLWFSALRSPYVRFHFQNLFDSNFEDYFLSD